MRKCYYLTTGVIMIMMGAIGLTQTLEIPAALLGAGTAFLVLGLSK